MPKRPCLPAEINTATMADIAFLLIVFFMLTTVFSANKGIEHVLPRDKEFTGEILAANLIEVAGANRIHVNRLPVHLDEKDLNSHLWGLIQANPGRTTYVYTLPEAKYGDMIAVLDQLRRIEAGIGPEYRMDLRIPTQKEFRELARYEWRRAP